jgi:hypothetical protein
MNMRLYIDEDAMSRALVQGLRARGVDVTTVLDEEMVGKDDEAQLAYATDQGRVIYTFNVGDFCNLHTEYITQGKEHAGIIVVHRLHYSIGEQIRQLADLINTKTAEAMMNQLKFL